MKTYTVIKDGFFNGDKPMKKDSSFAASPQSGAVRLALRHGQIKEATKSKSEDEGSSEPSKKSEYIEALKALGVEPPEGAKVAELKALYEEATKSEDEE